MAEPDDTFPVLLEKAEGVRIVVLNRPHANNTLDKPLRGALLRALEKVAADRFARVAVLTGAGENFCAGLDIEELATATGAEAEALAAEAARLQAAIAALPVPVIAACKGACLGGGLELALAADIRIARADARFGFPGMGVGLTPGGASLQRLIGLVGRSNGTALAMTGALVSAERAFMAGLVTNVLGAKDFDLGLEQLAGHLNALSPTALRELKALLRQADGAAPEAMAAAGAMALRRCFETGEARDLIKMLFGAPPRDAPLH